MVCQTVLLDQTINGAIGQPAGDQVIAHGREAAVLLGGHAVLLRAELCIDVAAALGLVDGQNGLIHAEAVHLTGAQCGADGGIIVVLTEGDAILPGVGVEGLGIKALAGEDALVDHLLHQSTGGGRAGGNAHHLVLQVSQRLDAGGILHQHADVVGVVGGREIPTLPALLGDGKGSQHAVDIAGIQQFAAGGGGNGGELYVYAQMLRDHLCQTVLQTGILAGEGILKAETLDGVLDTYLQHTAVDDCLHIRRNSLGGSCCAAGSGRGCGGGSHRTAGRAAAGGESGEGNGRTGGLDKATT